MQLLRSISYGLLALLALVAMACGGGNSQTEGTAKAAAAYKTFTYTNEGIAQILQLRWQNDTAVTFILEHRQGDCNYTLSGDAVNPYITYDPESDVDSETGETYWVDLYLYNRGSCRMAIRVAQDTSRAQLQLANCEASPTCALESAGVLRRENE
jgi:hypothetical protein